MITYKLSQNLSESLTFAKVAISNRLFIPRWTMREYLNTLDIVFFNTKVALAYDDDKPIGVALCSDYPDKNHLQVFIRKNYRRKGIGTNLLNIVNQNNGKTPYAVEGIKGSEKFFQKNNIECY